MSLSQLEASVQGEPERVYVVVGDARPLVDRAVAAIEAAMLPRLGLAAFNHSTYRASDPRSAEAFATARTPPMMADSRFVVVRELHEGTATWFGAFIDYLASPSPDTTVLVVGERFPKVEKGGSNWSAKVRNALKKHGGGMLVSLANKDHSPVGFAVDHAATRGKRLDRADAELLIEVVGGDLGRVEQELDKVLLYIGDAERVTSADITEACSMLAEAVIWDLTTGLAARDPERAIEALHRLQVGGDDARRLLGMIVWQMRELLKASELVRAGADDKKVRSAVRMRWDLYRAVKPILADGMPDAADLMRRIATANRQMNSHRADPQHLLEGLVLEMLEGRLRRPPPVPRPR